MFQIDLSSRVPIYEQLQDNIIQLIMKGVLKEGEQLPSVRALAKQICVNPNTVQKAFQELERSHYIYTVAGKGNFIANIGRDELEKKVLKEIQEVVLEAINVGIQKETIIHMIEELEPIREIEQ